MFEQCSLNLFNARNLDCLASETDSHVQTIKIMIFTESRNCNIRQVSHVDKIWGSTSNSCSSNAAWMPSMRELWIARPQRRTAMFKHSKSWFSQNPEIATSEHFYMLIKSGDQHQIHVWAMQPESLQCEKSELPGLLKLTAVFKQSKSWFSQNPEIATWDFFTCS